MRVTTAIRTDAAAKTSGRTARAGRAVGARKGGAAEDSASARSRKRARRSSSFCMVGLSEECAQARLPPFVVGARGAERDAQHAGRLGDGALLVEDQVQHF